jgi:D-beta-D-heptose 7-phosphate kinase/D-beta-D-heptose 1-phosphate adenosyltransferase
VIDPSLIDRLANARILVVGDVLLDRFVEGEVARISREAPVPVLKLKHTEAHLGGAGNVAANILATRGTVMLVGLVGSDAPADELRTLCAGFDRLKAEFIVDPARRTTVKSRYLSGWQQLLCLDAEDARPAASETGAALVRTAMAALADHDVLVLSDYARGALDDGAIAALIAAARRHGKPVVVDPRRSNVASFAGATLITPNLDEMAAFTGIRPETNEDAEAACRDLLAMGSIDAVLLTRGSAGMTLVERTGKSALHVAAETHRVFDVTGAGDTVVATIAAAIAVGAPLSEAVQLANTAAGIAVAKPGTATVLPQELAAALGSARGDGISDRAEAGERVRLWRALGLKVGFTNGVFDLLHRGHLHSLSEAKRRCDRLIVGVNADASVKRLKGPDRPVQDEQARAAILAGLRAVDLVVIFGEDTPEDLIRALKPDCLFKGADYAGADIPGGAFVKANGGTVELLPLLEGHSTTGTVARVRSKSTPS